MKRTIAVLGCIGLVGVVGILTTRFAASQQRITTTRQIQVIGAAGTNQTTGAWLVDLQANIIIYCERTTSAIQCHTTPVP